MVVLLFAPALDLPFCPCGVTMGTIAFEVHPLKAPPVGNDLVIALFLLKMASSVSSYSLAFSVASLTVASIIIFTIDFNSS